MCGNTSIVNSTYEGKVSKVSWNQLSAGLLMACPSGVLKGRSRPNTRHSLPRLRRSPRKGDAVHGRHFPRLDSRLISPWLRAAAITAAKLALPSGANEH